jgi:uncharacterized protein (DUF4415 family)
MGAPGLDSETGESTNLSRPVLMALGGARRHARPRLHFHAYWVDPSSMRDWGKDRPNSCVALSCNKARLQSCRNAANKSRAFSPEGMSIPRLTPEQLAGMVRLRDVRRKVPVSVRLDPQVLEWLRSKGEGHLTRINDILTNLMEAERRTGSGK